MTRALGCRCDVALLEQTLGDASPGRRGSVVSVSPVAKSGTRCVNNAPVRYGQSVLTVSAPAPTSST
jgi:hypothetical protein